MTKTTEPTEGSESFVVSGVGVSPNSGEVPLFKKSNLATTFEQFEDEEDSDNNNVNEFFVDSSLSRNERQLPYKSLDAK